MNLWYLIDKKSYCTDILLVFCALIVSESVPQAEKQRNGLKTLFEVGKLAVYVGSESDFFLWGTALVDSVILTLFSSIMTSRPLDASKPSME